jgi:hypothetical protein
MGTFLVRGGTGLGRGLDCDEGVGYLVRRRIDTFPGRGAGVARGFPLSSHAIRVGLHIQPLLVLMMFSLSLVTDVVMCSLLSLLSSLCSISLCGELILPRFALLVGWSLD